MSSSHMPSKKATGRGTPWVAFITALAGLAVFAAQSPAVEPLDSVGANAPATAELFWSFRPLVRPELPTSAELSLVANPIDRFLHAKLAERRLTPNKAADRRTLIRRVYYDLLGLPPTFEEVKAFEADSDPAAFERLVDRLLERPEYGERWARHWLDVARYADSMGFEHDFDRPFSYRYRDFVIRALNEDLPYDQFVKFQIAGDELAPDDRDALAATSFLTLGAFPTSLTEAEFERARYDQLDDMAGTTSLAVLGLTVSCARCHDHKYDPITSEDYYRFISTFTTTIIGTVEAIPNDASEVSEERRGELERLKEQLAWFERNRLPAMFHRHMETAGSDDPIVKLVAAGKRDDALKTLASENPIWQRFFKELEDYRSAKPKETVSVQVSSEGLPKPWHDANEKGFPHFYEKTYFLRRGDVERKGDEAHVGFLPILMRDGANDDYWKKPPPEGARTSHRRAALAHWLTDVDRGAGNLAARVIVNRLWQHHFGRGIVGTPNDFGTQGERPTHPELLDWLASELVSADWRLKPIHRLMLTSAAYQRSSESSLANAAIDSENHLLWRQNVQRLEAEAVRDSMLSIAGILDPTMYGPGTLDESTRRRSIYFRIKRSRIVPFLQVFDLPEPLTSQSVRPTTTVSPQALMLLNNRDVRSWADELANRLRHSFEDLPAAAVQRAFELALQRHPLPKELEDSLEFLSKQSAKYRDDGKEQPEDLALADFCHAIFCLNELVYVN